MDETNQEDSKFERTLDPIRPSEGDLLRDNMSYLYGRDPSILSYSHRPQISMESKVNLLSLYEVEESECQNSAASLDPEALASQTVKVYLRMKPFPRKIKITKEMEEAYRIVNATTLLTKLPCLDSTTISVKNKIHADTVTRKFTFTETFGQETTQLTIFEQAMKPMMVKFLAGQNCTAMTYGTTNSGKSHTLQGTPSCPGIIPRGLEYVFANINPRSTPCYKPSYNCEVISLNSVEKAQEIEIKTKLLALALTDKLQYVNAYKQMQKLLEEESPQRLSESTDDQYLVWVSFAEIYNETIHDLLSNDCQKRRPALKMATDQRGRPFIKGLKQICVNSGSEAYQVLMAGQYNLKVAATALNARSSRSHCIFTITLLKFCAESKPQSVEISKFSFCDLAGSERLKKTLNVGDRLKEAQNINTSLLVLGRCLKSIYEGQMIKHKNELAGPFRESKLTRLFQNALSGKEYMALIVNVNPLPNLYVETQNVLNLAAIAKKIVVEPKKHKRKKSASRFSLVVEQTQKTATDWDDKTDLEVIEEQTSDFDDNVSINHEDYDYLMEENEKLKREIAVLKTSALQRDLQIREEMSNVHSAMMAKLEANYMHRIKESEEQQEDAIAWSVNKVEEFYQTKLNQLESRKRRRTADSDIEDDEEDDIDELKLENDRLTDKVSSLKAVNKELRKQKDESDIKANTVSFELSMVKEELKNSKRLMDSIQKDFTNNTETISFIAELQNQLKQARERNVKLKEYLNEAKYDYIDITDDCRAKESQIASLEQKILNLSEKISDLEDETIELNALYEEKIQIIDSLEEQLDQLRLKKVQQGISLQKTTAEDTSRSEDSNHIGTSFDVSLGIKHIFANDENQVQITEDLREKLSNAEAENSVLNIKLSDQLNQIECLKNDINSMKNQLYQVTQDLNEFKNSPLVENNQSDQETDHNSEFKNESRVDNVCQTSFLVPENHNKSIQASFTTDADLIHAQGDVEKLKDEYNRLKSQFQLESDQHRDIVEAMKAASDMDRAEIGKFGERIIKLQESLDASVKEKEDLEKSVSLLSSSIQGMKEDQQTFVDRIEEYKKSIGTLEDQAKQFRETEERHLQDLDRLEAEIKGMSHKCESDHVPLLQELKKKVAEHEGSSYESSKLIQEQKDLLQAHIKNVLDLEAKLSSANDLKEEISSLNKKLETSQQKIEELKDALATNINKMKLMESQIEDSKKQEKEMEIEIKRLEQSCKSAIANSSTMTIEESNKMEKEHKFALKELKKLNAALEHSESINKVLQTKIDSFGEQATVHMRTKELFDMLQVTANDQKREVKELKEMNGSLIKKIDENELEKVNFEKNRDEMIGRYETLVKNTQEELERTKREVNRFQQLFSRQGNTPRDKDDSAQKSKSFRAPSHDRGRRVQDNRKEKDENTSDDESVGRRTRRTTRKPTHSSPNDTESVIELSGSESKRRPLLPPPQPTVCPSTEKKSTRKKKLFTEDDGCIDIINEPSPASNTRSLRTRRR